MRALKRSAFTSQQPCQMPITIYIIRLYGVSFLYTFKNNRILALPQRPPSKGLNSLAQYLHLIKKPLNSGNKMKGILIKWMAVLAVALSTPVAAGVIAYDNFDYSNGSLVPNGGWTNHSGTLGDLLVSGGQVVVQHGAPRKMPTSQSQLSPTISSTDWISASAPVT
jgi:hypothetical protein